MRREWGEFRAQAKTLSETRVRPGEPVSHSGEFNIPKTESECESDYSNGFPKTFI